MRRHLEQSVYKIEYPDDGYIKDFTKEEISEIALTIAKGFSSEEVAKTPITAVDIIHVVEKVLNEYANKRIKERSTNLSVMKRLESIYVWLRNTHEKMRLNLSDVADGNLRAYLDETMPAGIKINSQESVRVYACKRYSDLSKTILDIIEKLEKEQESIKINIYNK